VGTFPKSCLALVWYEKTEQGLPLLVLAETYVDLVIGGRPPGETVWHPELALANLHKCIPQRISGHSVCNFAIVIVTALVWIPGMSGNRTPETIGQYGS